MEKIRILTFDGGGIRGVISLELLTRLLEKCPQLIESTDVFAGTSSGSFIALGLANGLSPNSIKDLFSIEVAKLIFKRRRLGLLRPKYGHKNLIIQLHSLFQHDLTLRQLKRMVIVPSFTVNKCNNQCWGPVFFSNLPNSETIDSKVIEVALSSSAAPIYFPAFNNNIDGGVIANNPSTVAISLTAGEFGCNRSLNNIVLLSIGVGINPNFITTRVKKWGALQWILNPTPPHPIVSILLDGVTEADEYFSSQLLGDNYFRLNPILDEPINLDDYKKIPHLISHAQQHNIEPAIKWIEDKWL